MRRFNLRRLEDETGISGTGIVTEGYQYNASGICVMRWLTDKTSVAFYASMEDLEAIHGHNGKTVVEYLEDVPLKDVPHWVTMPLEYLADQIGF